jgi:2-keto-4-pentenoate hydratase/2-oxohepta-3-ene-1,7-dioic acid hydratase in catechol pathway
MKFARFEHKGAVLFGRVEGEELIALEGSLFDAYKETDTRYALSEVKLLPPVIPTKIACIGLNFREHIEEVGEEMPKIPRFFLKPSSSLIGHDDAIVFPKEAERVDYEGEMAVVIKKKMKEVSEEEALDYVLGFSCFNDVTERAIVLKSLKDLTLSKGFDTFSAFGPYVVSGLNPNNLELKTYLNGKIVQHDNTKNCVLTVEFILHYLSQGMTFYPGDIVITGTPKGIGPMKPGDVVEVELEGVGRLRNPVKGYGQG